MAKKEISNKTLTYLFDSDAKYEYNTEHGSEYPYNKFPPGLYGKKYKMTRFINWEPKQEDIIMRHAGSQIFIDFLSVFPNNNINPATCIFQMRSKRLDLQNLICEQINFFCALYDDDNDLITSMLIGKCLADSQDYTINTFMEFYTRLFDILFPQSTIDKIRNMVNDNNIGDDVVGPFPEEFCTDAYIVSFMIKVSHIFIEHFVLSTGNSPKNLFELFAQAYTHCMSKINPNMYILLYDYVNKCVMSSISSNMNIYDMQALEGVTAPTTSHFVMRKIMLCDGLIKLTFACNWDKINKRPKESCVGLIKAIVNQASFVIRKAQLRYSLVNSDDMSQLLDEAYDSTSPISLVRTFNPGQFCCMYEDLKTIIAKIALVTDLNPLDFYIDNLPKMNELSELLINTVLYNGFHCSLSTTTLNTKQKYILLMYVRNNIMLMYNLTEQDTVDNCLINILTAKPSTVSNRTLTPKDIGNIKKYVKLTNLKEYLLNDKNVDRFIENIMKCVFSTYTIVNHNDESLLNRPLVYDSNKMTLDLLDMIITLFESFK